MVRGIVVCLFTLVAFVSSSAVAHADFPYLPASGGNPKDSQTFHNPPGDTPANLNDDYKFAATPETPDPAGGPQAADSVRVNNQVDELCGVRGTSIADKHAFQPTASCLGPALTTPVNTAFNVSTGRPDVTIAVLDSGIEWNNADAMTALANKVRLNKGELQAPRSDRGTPLIPGLNCSNYGTPTGGDYNPDGDYDVNNDGVFNIKDYACDSRVSLSHAGRHGPSSVLTPEDITLAFSNGADNDSNGFKDDIAGWDFVDNDNNPYDDVQYGHGTGEARDSNGEAYKDQAHKGSDLGTCPNCTVLPLRVGESFIADVNRFAQAVLYATDSGALVVQEALGTLNNSNLARDAVNYAYTHGTTIIASAADEAAEHHNQPGALPHVILVNSIRPYDPTFTAIPRSYLQFNGCTNFSTKVTISVSSSSCSSEATGKSAGVAGLVYSAALNAHERQADQLPASRDCTRPDGTACVITPNEVRQLMGTGTIGSTTPADTGDSHSQSDDVNFEDPASLKSCSAPTPTCTDPNAFTFNLDQTGQGLVAPLPDSQRYKARKGADEFYGFGRLNSYKAAKATSDGTIPPEAEINSPDWFDQIDPSKPTLAVTGHVFARGQAYQCRIEVAPGGQPNNTQDFQPAAGGFCDGSTTHTDAEDGTLGTISLSDLRSRFPLTLGNFDGTENGGTPQTSNGRPNTLPYAFTVRVVVTTGSGSTGMSGEDRRQMFLHRDADQLSGFPKELRTDGDSSPVLADLNADNRNELVVGTSDGVVHAYRRDGSELPGWPVHTDQLALHTGQQAFTSDGVGTGHYGAVLGAVAVGDLFHSGTLDVVVADNEGKVYAWDPSGRQVFKREADPSFSGNPATSFERQGPTDRVEHGFFASPVLANLSGDPNGPLDIIAAGEDRHLYAWHANGNSVQGFPFLVIDRTKVASIGPHDQVHFKSDAAALMQGKIVDTPAVADLNGDGAPEIVVGTNEEYKAGAGSEGSLNSSNQEVGALGNTGILSFGNTRLYAIQHDGGANPKGPYLPGWPKKLGVINTQLLPDVGEGVTGNPVIGKVACKTSTNGNGPKIGAETDAGFAYLFNPDGSSCLGSSNGQDTPFATSGGSGIGQTDQLAFAAVGNPAFGKIGPNGQTAFLGPVTGVLRALDIVAPEYQIGSQDFLGVWDPQTGNFQTKFPGRVNDLQFLTGPGIGTITAGGSEAALEGTASLDLTAFDSTGATVAGWPKLTGDWTVANPTLGSFGTVDTDAGAKKNVVSLTRTGTLAAYGTPAGACSADSWPRFHHDDASSGNYDRDAVAPGRIDAVTVDAGKLTFTAPGGDLMCGKVDHYALRGDNGEILPDLAGADLKAAGARQDLVLGSYSGKTVTIYAVDAAGNEGRGVVVTLATGDTTVLPPTTTPTPMPVAPKPAPKPTPKPTPVAKSCLTGPLRFRSAGRSLARVTVGARNASLNRLKLSRHGRGILTACVKRSKRPLVIAVTRGHVILVGTRSGVVGTLRPGVRVKKVRGLRRVRGYTTLYRRGRVYAVVHRGRVSSVFITSIHVRHVLRATLRRGGL